MRIRTTFAGGILMGLGGTLVFATYINANLTPIHVERDSKLIFSVRIAPPAAGDLRVSMDVLEVLKGEVPFKRVPLVFSNALAQKEGPAAVNDFLDLLRKDGAEPGVIAAGGGEGNPSALFHAGGVWARLIPASGSGPWQFDRIDVDLKSTFNGGTDMLIETFRSLRKHPDTPLMRCDSGVTWDSHDVIGRLAGACHALAAVDVNGDGVLDLHAQGDRGDKVWINKVQTFEELAGITWVSREAAWADFDRDGRVDCASLGPDGLKVFLQKAPRKFSPVEVRLPGKVEGPWPTLSVVDVRADGTPGLVLSTGAPPVLLRNTGKDPLDFESQALGAAVPREWGAAGPCVVADFDGDGFPDILQCYEKDGVLFRGKPGGSFEPRPGCGAAMGTVGSRRATLGDVDGNGTLEVLLAGGGAVPVLLEYRDGRFRDVMAFCGEPSYIVQAGAQGVAVGDFNNDTFQDFFAFYPDQGGQFFFNRGFRSFAIAEPLRIREDAVPSAERGQTAAVWADFDRDGAQDLAFASAAGEVFLSKTTLGTKNISASLAVRLAPEAPCAAPVNVSFFVGERRLGTRRAEKAGPPAEMGVDEPARITVRFRLPGRPETERIVEVGQKRVEIIIGGK